MVKVVMQLRPFVMSKCVYVSSNTQQILMTIMMMMMMIIIS